MSNNGKREKFFTRFERYFEWQEIVAIMNTIEVNAATQRIKRSKFVWKFRVEKLAKLIEKSRIIRGQDFKTTFGETTISLLKVLNLDFKLIKPVEKVHANTSPNSQKGFD
jgi:hypothetical protein